VYRFIASRGFESPSLRQELIPGSPKKSTNPRFSQ
jgi:hypothetical protein